MSAPTVNDPVGCANPPGSPLAGSAYDPNAALYRDVETSWCYPYSPYGSVQRVANFYGVADPTPGVGILFLALFVLLFIVHVALAVRSRRSYWIYLASLALLAESIGWLCRTLSGFRNDWSNTSRNYFLGQICSLTLAPAVTSAFLYCEFVVLSRLYPGLSRISPTKLAIGSVVADLICLSVQAVGGALGAVANTAALLDTSSLVMLLGISVQSIVMLVFVGLAFDFIRRARLYALKRLIMTSAAASVLVILRNTYRIVELSGGWEGYVYAHEIYFLIFDAAFMVIASALLAVGHPTFTLPITQAARATIERPLVLELDVHTPVEKDQQLEDKEDQQGLAV